MIRITASAEAELVQLAKSSRVAARQLALLALDLERDPRPEHSHKLPSPPGVDDRVWELPLWTITYRLGPSGIEIAEIQRVDT